MAVPGLASSTEAQATAADRVCPAGGLRLHILKEDWHDLGQPYTADDVLPRLRSAYPSQVLVELDVCDIHDYDWSNHEVRLNEQGSEQMVRALAFQERSMETFSNGFVMTLDGRWLYGGVFYPSMGAAALRFPVIHANLSEGSVSLRIRGCQRQEPCVTAGEAGGDNETAIQDAELLEWLTSRRKIRSHERGTR